MKFLVALVFALCATQVLSLYVASSCDCTSDPCDVCDICTCTACHDCTTNTCTCGTCDGCVTSSVDVCTCQDPCGSVSQTCCDPICIEPIEPEPIIIPEICTCTCCEEVLTENPYCPPDPTENPSDPCTCEPDDPLICPCLECPEIDLCCPEVCGPEDPCFCEPDPTCLCGPICSDIEQQVHCDIIPEDPVCPCEPCGDIICCDCCGSEYDPDPYVCCPDVVVCEIEVCEIDTYTPEYECPTIITDPVPCLPECECDCNDFVHLSVECDSDLDRTCCCDINGELPTCCETCIDVVEPAPCCHDDVCTCSVCDGCSTCEVCFPCDVYADYECSYCPSIELVTRDYCFDLCYDIPEGCDIQEYCRQQCESQYECLCGTCTSCTGTCTCGTCSTCLA